MRATFLQSQNYKIIIYYKKDLEMCIILSYIYIYFFFSYLTYIDVNIYVSKVPINYCKTTKITFATNNSSTILP